MQRWPEPVHSRPKPPGAGGSQPPRLASCDFVVTTSQRIHGTWNRLIHGPNRFHRIIRGNSAADSVWTFRVSRRHPSAIPLLPPLWDFLHRPKGGSSPSQSWLGSVVYRRQRRVQVLIAYRKCRPTGGSKGSLCSKSQQRMHVEHDNTALSLQKTA